jgi:hypothetical protein
MSGVTGRDVKGLAFAKFATNSWGVAASVTKGTYFQSDGGLKYEPERVNDDAFGQQFLSEGDFGNLSAQNLTWPGRARYESHEYVLEALAMGSPAAVTISTSAAGQVTSWQHVIDLAPSIDGLGITGAVDRGLFVDELTSAKVVGFMWDVGDSGVMDEKFKVLGTTATNISSININSTVAGAAFPALNDRVFMKQGTFRMNVQSGSGLAVGDKVDAEKIDWSFDRPQDAPHVFGQDYIYEPGDNGFPMIKFTVSYPRMNSVTANSLRTALQVDQTFKADMTYLGAFINSTDKYKILFQFPCVEIDSWEAPLAGPNQVKPKASFTCKKAATSPTGMAFVNPFRLTRIMTNSVVAF